MLVLRRPVGQSRALACRGPGRRPDRAKTPRNYSACLAGPFRRSDFVVCLRVVVRVDHYGGCQLGLCLGPVPGDRLVDRRLLTLGLVALPMRRELLRTALIAVAARGLLSEGHVVGTRSSVATASESCAKEL
jgi:hypothetical protein